MSVRVRYIHFPNWAKVIEGLEKQDKDNPIIVSAMDMSLSNLREIVKDRKAWHAAVHRVTKRHDRVTEQQQQQLNDRLIADRMK